jgi:diguanylate cyclase (GGDEF)-like protein/PAS domain S-box-containing protein
LLIGVVLAFTLSVTVHLARSVRKKTYDIYVINKIHASEIHERQLIETELIKSENKLRGLLENAPDGMVIINKEGKIELVSHQLEKMSGFTSDELIDQSVEMLVPGRFEHHTKSRNNFLAHPKTRAMDTSLELFLLRKDGSECPVEISLSPIQTEDGIIVIANIQDITERKISEEILSLSEENYRTLVGSSPYCIHQINAEGNFLSMNRSGLKMMGETEESAMVDSTYLDAVGENDRERISKLMCAALSGDYNEFKFEGSNGHIFQSNFVPIFDSEKRVTRLLGITQDITKNKKAEELLRFQASHDSLTGLVNRYYFERHCEKLILSTKEYLSSHALCYLDLDQFKVVNDTCGHAAGDELLRQITFVLQGEVRKHDTLGCLGGDEFGVLMEDCSLDAASRVSQNLLKAVHDYQFVWGGARFLIGCNPSPSPKTV